MISYQQKLNRVKQSDSSFKNYNNLAWLGFQWKGFRRSLRWTHKLILGLIVLLYVGSFWFQLRINTTHSLSHYLYLVQKHHLPKKGEFAGFTHPLFYGVVIKRVSGVPGDKIEIKNHNIYIAGQHICPLVDKNSKGEPLIPAEEKLIPQGYYFVSGDHRRSFDSCYQAFGLVHQSQVEGRAWPIF